MVDVEKVTSNLKKSESIRLELESHLLKSKKDTGEYFLQDRRRLLLLVLSSVLICSLCFSEALRETLKKSSEREKRLNEDYKNCRDKLAAVNKDRLSYSVCKILRIINGG